MYGLNPRSISSRIAKLTYGINTLTTFDNKKYPLEKKVVIDGEDFCEVYFLITRTSSMLSLKKAIA